MTLAHDRCQKEIYLPCHVNDHNKSDPDITFEIE